MCNQHAEQTFQELCNRPASGNPSLNGDFIEWYLMLASINRRLPGKRLYCGFLPSQRLKRLIKCIVFDAFFEKYLKSFFEIVICLFIG
jgi:hypothetical protein